VLEERICNRRTDPHTGIIYNLVTKPPPSHDVEVINRLEQRKDDTKEALSTRLVEYVCPSTTVCKQRSGFPIST